MSAGRRPSLALARRLSSHAAALAGFAAMCTGGEMPLLATAIFLGAVGLSLARRDKVFPGLGVALMVATAGLGVVLLFLVAQGALDLVLAASLFSGAVCANRLLSRRGPQDDPLLLLTTFAAALSHNSLL